MQTSSNKYKSLNKGLNTILYILECVLLITLVVLTLQKTVSEVLHATLLVCMLVSPIIGVMSLILRNYATLIIGYSLSSLCLFIIAYLLSSTNGFTSLVLLIIGVYQLKSAITVRLKLEGVNNAWFS